ncbi:DUF4149 domain-containing protein [Granulicella sibirica]|uniref:TMEM205-like domain-containing protein n=1 Tax=Granulicella sibirica TaxID=2479048 RepID=A0A4V1L5H9_9BACT|nr:DUF4149 domain-containing protein [Granulicella sibirica]RXH55824.1 hypothetical protein GRAN_2681 [Granulicella sibirica]
MPTVLRALRLLSIVVWVGGITFFAFVVAPVAFGNLPSPHEAGIVVRYTLLALHSIGMVCGTVFLLASILLLQASRRPRNVAIQAALIALMLLITATSQFGILPRMERDRLAANGIIESIPPTDPARIDFERLHPLSERLEGATLLLGLATILLMARDEPIPPAAA